MITSMTGFGNGEASNNGVSVSVEVRSLNSRFLEIFSNLPKKFYFKEFEMRELVKGKMSRGKLNITVTVEYGANAGASAVKANLQLAEAYYTQLQEVRKQLKLKDAVTLEHVLAMPDIFKNTDTDDDSSEREWQLIVKAMTTALDKLNNMRLQEGRELSRDLFNRMKNIEKNCERVEQIAQERVPQERQKLREKVAKLFENDEIDSQRLEMEIVLLADKLDISEECVRMRSHIKFFLEALKDKEQAGRKINFLLQEMNREVNTMGSKANDATISQVVVGLKEDLERIREQVQNVE
ncbi:MAG: YicC family protein [Candidatus Kapaibacterium sp.]|nr:MAG: YicC family protein [Candidatus Kapabacteria bacterium]